MKIFVDTSAFYALADEDDRHHHRAKEIYESLIAGEELFTSDYVLVECWFLIGSRLGREAALKFWDGLSTGIVEMIKVEPSDLAQAREILRRFPDQDFSLVDATSFAVMERKGIETAFTFDSDFRVYRFGKGNRGYFKVIPE
ncbi:PIN domain-containing protein [Candidatus Bipolaricaulota bacterium]|nr:PIN domain-containing protein [Candidatus Bipolaricaulota bacterium]